MANLTDVGRRVILQRCPTQEFHKVCRRGNCQCSLQLVCLSSLWPWQDPQLHVARRGHGTLLTYGLCQGGGDLWHFQFGEEYACSTLSLPIMSDPEATVCHGGATGDHVEPSPSHATSTGHAVWKVYCEKPRRLRLICYHSPASLD